MGVRIKPLHSAVQRIQNPNIQVFRLRAFRLGSGSLIPLDEQSSEKLIQGPLASTQCRGKSQASAATSLYKSIPIDESLSFPRNRILKKFVSIRKDTTSQGRLEIHRSF